jgi:hypothetical protein
MCRTQQIACHTTLSAGGGWIILSYTQNLAPFKFPFEFLSTQIFHPPILYQY